MISRLKTIAQTEKLKHPEGIAFILLIKRIIHVLLIRLRRRSIAKDSTFRTEDTMPMCSLFPKKVLNSIISEIKPRSLLDVGCGTGVSLSYFIEHGIDAIGIENSDLAIKKSKYPKKIIKRNLKKPVRLNRQFDVVWCFEVIEHIHPDFEKNILKTLTSNGSLIILSAAKPGQGGHGHFNEQPSEYWIEKFKNLGFTYNPEFTLVLKNTKDTHSDNLLVFYKTC